MEEESESSTTLSSIGHMISNQAKHLVQRVVVYVTTFHQDWTMKDIFISLVSLTIILSGVGHMVISHHLDTRQTYMDAELQQAKVDEEQARLNDDPTEADYLYSKVRVLCMIMSSRESLWTRAVHVNATWGRRCNKILFMTDVSDPTFPLAVGIYPSTGRHFLTQKVFESFDYIYDHHIADADWFIKCDDDTYVIMENLRHFLSDKDPNDGIFYGQHFRNTKRISYFTGGAGYVLSKKALKVFRYRDPQICKASWEGSNEDVRMSECLTRSGVLMGNSRDELGRTRFHAFPPWTHVQGGFPPWYKFRSVWGLQKGISSISPYAISFHKFDTSESLYVLEYFVYHLRPYGIRFGLGNPDTSTGITHLFT